MDIKGIDRAAKRIRGLIKERAKREAVILRRRPMVAASLCRRANDTYYLSASIDGESRHRYVRKADLKYWKGLAEEWKVYSVAIAEWVVINTDIEHSLRAFGKNRAVYLPSGKKRGYR